MQAVIRVVTAKQKLAIDRNTKYYTGLTQQLVPGDLVFAFTERKGEPGYDRNRNHAVAAAPEPVEM